MLGQQPLKATDNVGGWRARPGMGQYAGAWTDPLPLQRGAFVLLRTESAQAGFENVLHF